MQKFSEILTKEDLIYYFEGRNFDKINLEIRDYEDKKNYDKHNIKIEELKTEINQDLRNSNIKEISKSDAYFSNKIFNQLKDFPRRDLTDIRFWQWLGLEHFQSYIWLRWGKSNAPSNNDEKIKIIKTVNKDRDEIWSSITTRFLGGTSLKSLTSRHALSRLFWPHYILEEEETVKLCFEKQDIAVAVFERQYGMNPEAAKAFIKNISKKHSALGKKNIQREAKKLNRYFATVNVDYLDQNSIKKLLFV